MKWTTLFRLQPGQPLVPFNVCSLYFCFIRASSCNVLTSKLLKTSISACKTLERLKQKVSVLVTFKFYINLYFVIWRHCLSTHRRILKQLHRHRRLSDIVRLSSSREALWSGFRDSWGKHFPRLLSLDFRGRVLPAGCWLSKDTDTQWVLSTVTTVGLVTPR